MSLNCRVHSLKRFSAPCTFIRPSKSASLNFQLSTLNFCEPCSVSWSRWSERRRRDQRNIITGDGSQRVGPIALPLSETQRPPL